MTILVAVSGIGGLMLLAGAAIAGLAFGMMINTMISGRRKK